MRSCLYYRGMPSPIVSALRSGETGSLAGVLADDVVFSSPVADYHGRESVSRMLAFIAQVVADVVPGREWHDERDSVYAFTAHVGGAQVQGLMREQSGSSGLLTGVTLFLRPYAVLRTAIAAMRQLMEEPTFPRRPE